MSFFSAKPGVWIKGAALFTVHRWYEIAVVCLWLASMGWLVGTKVYPNLVVGEPPKVSTIVDAQLEQPVVGWWMYWNGQKIGWALNKTFREVQQYPVQGLAADPLTKFVTRVHFDQLPLKDIIPGTLQLVFGEDISLLSRMSLDLRNELTIDPLKRICQFDTNVRFGNLQELIRLSGSVDEGKVELRLYCGGITYETETTLPNDMWMQESLSPQPSLPDLRLGQHWTTKVYSPLGNPGNPTEILHAKVESFGPVRWNQRVVNAFMVVYRSDPGQPSSSGGEIRGRMWVRPDGVVIRQEAKVFGGVLTFDRMAVAEAKELEPQFDALEKRHQQTGLFKPVESAPE